MLVTLLAIFNKKLRFFFYQFWFFLLRFYPGDIAVAIDLNSGVGADDGAQTAAGTFSLSFLDREIARFVGFSGDGNTVFIADSNTQAAAFTTFGINYYFTRHRDINPVVKITKAF
jgi:hypothetical protein